MRVVFDLDGTLVDSAPDIRAVANSVLADEGRAPITLAEAKSFIGNGARIFVRRLMTARGLGEDGSQIDRLHAAFVDRYEGAVGQSALYPGVTDGLAALAEAGFRLGVCTNKPHGPALSVLEHFGIVRQFAVVIGGDSLPVHKPDPAPLLAAADALGNGPCVFVGDSEVDAETAERAGLPFALFTQGYRKAAVADIRHDRAFGDFAMLADIVHDLTRP